MLLDWTDYEAVTNSTLSDPDGRALADRIGTSILAWSARYCNRLGWSSGTYTEYFSSTEYLDQFYLSALPLDTAQPVTVTTYNANTTGYDSYTGTVRARDNGVVKTS